MDKNNNGDVPGAGLQMPPQETELEDESVAGQQTREDINVLDHQRPQDGKHASKPAMPTAMKIAVVFILAIILFAFYWQETQRNAINNRAGEGGQNTEQTEHGDLFPNYPPQGRSLIQDEINSLDWIDKEFIPLNEFSRPGILLEEINGIVIHFIGNPNTTAAQNRNFFANVAPAEGLHVSSNFIVGLDGEILQLVPVDEIAYASHHRNSDTLSIELCHPDETGEFTDETYASAVRLTAWLCMRFGLTADNVIRHFDVVRSDGTQKECPVYFVENEGAWEAFRDDVSIILEQRQLA